MFIAEFEVLFQFAVCFCCFRVGAQVIPEIEFVPIPRESHVKMNGLFSKALRGISFHEHEVRGRVVWLRVADVTYGD